MRASAALALLAAAGCAPTTTPAATPSIVAVTAPPTGARALHLAGEPPAPTTEIGAPGTIVEAAYDVCLDEHARVASVTPAPGLAAADEAIATTLRHWSWFVASNDARPCWRERVLLGVPIAGRVLRQAGTQVSARPAARPATTPPAWLSALYAGTLVDGTYKVCAGEDGVVQSVRAVAGADAADPYFMAALRATAWEIVVGPLAQAPYCFAAPMHLDLRSGVRAGVVPLPPPGTRAREVGQSIVVPLPR